MIKLEKLEVNAFNMDDMVERAARVSHSPTGAASAVSRKQADLLDYLLRHKHWTPFSHVKFTFVTDAFTQGTPNVIQSSTSESENIRKDSLIAMKCSQEFHNVMYDYRGSVCKNVEVFSAGDITYNLSVFQLSHYHILQMLDEVLSECSQCDDEGRREYRKYVIGVIISSFLQLYREGGIDTMPHTIRHKFVELELSGFDLYTLSPECSETVLSGERTKDMFSDRIGLPFVYCTMSDSSKLEIRDKYMLYAALATSIGKQFYKAAIPRMAVEALEELKNNPNMLFDWDSVEGPVKYPVLKKSPEHLEKYHEETAEVYNACTKFLFNNIYEDGGFKNPVNDTAASDKVLCRIVAPVQDALDQMHTYTFAMYNIPLWMMMQFLRHRHGVEVNQMSLRYTEMPDEYATVDVDNWRLATPRKSDAKTAQNVLESGDVDAIYSLDLAESAVDSMLEAYNYAIDHGVAKESAREILPMGSKTAAVVTLTREAAERIVGLRGRDTHAQQEWYTFVDELSKMLEVKQ